MKPNQALIYDTKRLMMIRYPRFGKEIANTEIEYKTDLKYRTAATDGKKIYFDPEHLASLSDDDRLFLIAHELMHIKFEHMYRLESLKGEKKNFQVWNEATDAIINANLERDGFTIKKGYVNRTDALNYSAEEFYKILLKEKKNKEQSQSDIQSGTKQGQNNEQEITDDHSLWEEALKNKKINDKQQNIKVKKIQQKSIDEKSEFEENRKERKNCAKENFERLKNEGLKLSGEKVKFGNVGEAKPILDWKLLLRREVEKTETIWSQRKSFAENNFAFRLEENDIEDEALTEVMIDVSGSVSIEMVKNFLRQLKPLLKESKLSVGCFNKKFWGMREIKANKDIDKFSIPIESRGYSAGSEDWDLAVRSFSKRREVNKIVFTDGIPQPGTMPKEDLKGTNVIWLVYANEKFNPCCGKVIMVDKEQLKSMQMINHDGEMTR